MIWVAASVALALVVVFLASRFAAPKDIPAQPSKAIEVDFSSRKRAADDRIDKEAPSEVVDEFNRPPGV